MSNNKRVIIVDDEPDIIDLVVYNLKKEGFVTDSARSGTAALKKIREGKFDIVILDLMLPEMDGLELCRILKKDPALSDMPIIMLTAKGEEIDRILGLELGADDYITKPFSPREMVARVNAVLRRSGLKRDGRDGKGILEIGNLEIDREKYTVKKNGLLLSLSIREFKLLLYLAERPGRVFSRDSLLDAVWGDDAYVEPRTVDVHIRRLRERVEDDPSTPAYILTRRGVGYYFAEEV
ncbi:Phosphate regulon transcriptional regulatory protein PhoB (SphR) [hydrothermal vent metagenome]|uniref:Phosphate regulon transcriptional regulatory protein PhoB (SphR) n=1 Tax=hydrothermal vent metagenome TaxID=652676 RepID=A0A3B1CWL3_9ZZZZ